MRVASRFSLSAGIGSQLAVIGRALFHLPTSRALHFHEYSPTLITAAQMIGDGLILTTLSYISLSIIIDQDHASSNVEYSSYIGSTMFMVAVLILGFARADAYNVFDEFESITLLKSTLKCFTIGILSLTACFFILKISDNVSRCWLVTWSTTSVIALCGFRLVAASVVRRFKQNGRLTKKIAIVGASGVGQQLAKFIQGRSDTRLVGIFDEHRSRLVESESKGTTVHQLPTLYELLYRGQVDEVVIAIPPYASNQMWELSRRFHSFAVSLRVVAPEGYENFSVLDSRRYAHIGTFRVMRKPLDEVAALVKRIEDIVIAVISLLVMLPCLFVIALAIKLDSPGPVLFRQKRLGANNLAFSLLKYRSMYVEQADPLGRQLTRAEDPRVTRVGKFLRRTSLDELPQLINVLRGEMSLIGPRPHALAASAAGIAYARAVADYPIRHRMKPGITGWAQVNGWRGETTTIEQIRQRVEHDLYYIENWSVTFDLLILGRTIFAILSRANAI
jgi:polysaccharide biosynthesis protein PslA